ncbi:MAG: hypothetical protein ACODAQ_12155 [Phycisphaeraceae bacterium]
MPEHGRQGEQLDQDEIKQQIVAALQRRRDARRPGELPRPVPAIVIAQRFGIRIGGSRDSRRRGARELIRALRKEGTPILPHGKGYYLASDLADYQAAEQYARRNGLQDLALAATIKHHPERADTAGQLGLFAGDQSGRR